MQRVLELGPEARNAPEEPVWVSNGGGVGASPTVPSFHCMHPAACREPASGPDLPSGAAKIHCQRSLLPP